MATKYKNEKQFNLAGVTYDGRQKTGLSTRKTMSANFNACRMPKILRETSAGTHVYRVALKEVMVVMRC